MRSYDVVIVGGGPAGALAAIGAVRANPTLSVGLVDPDSGPRHRIGEALLTGTVMTLADAGIDGEVADAGFHHKVGGAYVWGAAKAPWYVNYPDAEPGTYPDRFHVNGKRVAIHVPRHVFDPLVTRCAERLGVEVVKASVEEVGVVEGPTGPAVSHLKTSRGERIVARRYVDATGQAALFSRRLTRRTPVGQARISRYAYTGKVDWAEAVRHGFDPHRTNIVSNGNGWFWVIHLGAPGDGLTSVGFVSTPDLLAKIDLANCTEAFPELAMFGFREGYLDPRTFDGKVADRLYGHPDYSFACERLEGDNWAIAGDAAMFIDPILSQGVTLATHYGFLRGRAAAAEADGLEGAQANVTMHYRREGAIMRQVVGEWYGNNRSADGWKMATAVAAREAYGVDLDPNDAFRWITNLENIRDEYDPYPPSERANIRRMLGMAGEA